MQIISEPLQKFNNEIFDEISIQSDYLIFFNCVFNKPVFVETLHITFIGCTFYDGFTYDSDKVENMTLHHCRFVGGFRSLKESIKFENEDVISDAFKDYIETIDMRGIG